jgi:hypothetical protein
MVAQQTMGRITAAAMAAMTERWAENQPDVRSTVVESDMARPTWPRSQTAPDATH